MENEKDRFGDTMRLVERAKEDIYFAEHDRALLEKLRAQLRKSDAGETAGRCPKCGGNLEGYTFHGVALDRCPKCGGIWLDQGELEAIVTKLRRGPLGEWLDRLTAKT
ncbi:MAG TPA: zf-TFIIB domain-containing protein [Methylomirabilota bacterium]|nr:zf-TFIIB domain-containing protein [Methylomirabilota bacterium]